MKKILILLLVAISLNNSFGYEIKGRNSYGQTYGICKNGDNFVVGKYGNSYDAIGPNGTSRNNSSESEAIKKACTQEIEESRKIITIIKGAVVFKKKKLIISALSSEISYSASEGLASLNGGDRFIINKDLNVSIISYHKPQKGMIDGYYKIADDTGKVYFIRKSMTK